MTCRPCALLRSKSSAPGIRAIPRGSRILVVVPSGTCTFQRTAVAIVRSRTPRGRLSSSPVRAADAPALSAIGDPFMFQEHYADRTPEQVAAIFGSHFAGAVRQLPVGTWQGPIESGLGWHLVFVDTLIPGRVPPFEEVEADVKAAWLAEQKAMASDRAFTEMRAKYMVRLPVPPENASGPQAAALSSGGSSEAATKGAR